MPLELHAPIGDLEDGRADGMPACDSDNVDLADEGFDEDAASLPGSEGQGAGMQDLCQEQEGAGGVVAADGPGADVPPAPRAPVIAQSHNWGCFRITHRAEGSWDQHLDGRLAA
jgi:hypothetical protein